MGRRRTSPTTADPRQGTFQDGVPGGLGVGHIVRSAIARTIKDCPYDRIEIAARMTRLVYGDAGDGEITKAQIDSWTRSDDAWRMPAELLPAFCAATGSLSVLELIAELSGARLAAGKQAYLAELGALALQEEQIKARRAAIEAKVKAHG